MIYYFSLFQPIIPRPMFGKGLGFPLPNLAENSIQAFPELEVNNAFPLRRPAKMVIGTLYFFTLTTLLTKHMVPCEQ